VVEKNYTSNGATRARRIDLPLRERLHVPSVKHTGKQVTLKRGGYDIFERKTDHRRIGFYMLFSQLGLVCVLRK
jgi:hypothetical protein